MFEETKSIVIPLTQEEHQYIREKSQQLKKSIVTTVKILIKKGIESQQDGSSY